MALIDSVLCLPDVQYAMQIAGTPVGLEAACATTRKNTMHCTFNMLQYPSMDVQCPILKASYMNTARFNDLVLKRVEGY